MGMRGNTMGRVPEGAQQLRNNCATPAQLPKWPRATSAQHLRNNCATFAGLPAGKTKGVLDVFLHVFFLLLVCFCALASVPIVFVVPAVMPNFVVYIMICVSIFLQFVAHCSC